MPPSKFQIPNSKFQKNIGILAFQGDVTEHQAIIEKLGHRFIPIRSPSDLHRVDALIIPGGESTTIGFFLEETGLAQAIKERVQGSIQTRHRQSSRSNSSSQRYQKPLPIWGTCAGAIVLAQKIKSNIIPPHLGLIDMTIERNAYGRQIDSFYTSIDIPKLKIKKLSCAFIRAPIILGVGKSKMPSIDQPEVLATHEGKIVMVRQGNLLASTFHPELTGDTRLHEWFIGNIDT